MVSVDKFGNLPKKSKPSVKNKRYDKIFADKFNIAAIVMKGDEPAGSYSSTLKSSPYANVSIKNILQMNSGVSPIGRDDEK